MNMTKKTFRFLMISAMYENGGNTTQRYLDGHPELFVYPFESQVGTKFVNDFLGSLYPLKYRWPIFPNSMTTEEIYESIIDEEMKVCAKTPYVSKFRTADFDFSDRNRKHIFARLLEDQSLTRSTIVEAFFRSTFEAWKNYNRTGDEQMYVGYSPIIAIDADKIISDYQGNAYVLHIIRNPFSAYADTKKRAVPLSLEHYMMGWNTCQYFAFIFAKKYPANVFILRYEDLIENPYHTLTSLLAKIGIKSAQTLGVPSWNRKELKEIYPWGTIRIPTREVNVETAKELSKDEIQAIHDRAHMYISQFNYENFYRELIQSSAKALCV